MERIAGPFVNSEAPDKDKVVANIDSLREYYNEKFASGDSSQKSGVASAKAKSAKGPTT